MNTPQDPNTELLERMRSFETDHKPHGWPAIQMRDVSALCDRIARLESELARPESTAVGLMRARIAELEAQIEAVGAGGVALSMSMFASRKDYDEAKAAQPAPAVVEPVAATVKESLTVELVAAQSRFKGGRGGWCECTIEHHNMVQANPIDWPGYEVRLLYTAPEPHQMAEPASPLDAGHFYNLVMHTLMDVGTPGCKHRLEAMADELRNLMRAATPKTLDDIRAAIDSTIAATQSGVKGGAA